ncbi:hypothetical protein BUALT_Bualt08G0111100 [Buddleja alternifolia]|uniref:Uncharacterized protein n=1 Tax=Buddleja alternifolia TaxID=168488 RepID=A0AAV6XGI0_9LAMI|nr:hypothetical protein BUALT_Bualt08G0111100 [Buddleja alternifolia]
MIFSHNSRKSNYVLGEKEYYERQFTTLKYFEEVDSLDSHNVVDEEADIQEQTQHEKAMNISNWGNVFLLAFKWIDPAGAIALAVYTITNWSGTVLENAVSLVGQTAPPEVLQKLTYLVLRRDAKIKHVDTVRAYTFCVLYFVEIDIELPEDLPLKEAHTIGESLQIKIEELPEV